MTGSSQNCYGACRDAPQHVRLDDATTVFTLLLDHEQ
jgi:hypothetical protein